jgi:esterase/lipase superfamily enzyme
MHTEHHKWYSEHLGREMELKVYGHYGKPFIVFPCSKGRFFDYEDFGMIDQISEHIENGKIKLYTVDSVDGESWYDLSVFAGERNARHELYDKYIAEEVTPFIRTHCNSPEERPMATGASMGAYHSINYFLKHPDICGGTIALSGLYRLNRNEFSLSDEEISFVYHNSPVHYLSNVSDPAMLKMYNESDIIICTGQGAWEDEAVEDTKSLEYSLKKLNVSAWVDYWGNDVNHDWPWWFKQMNYFIEKIYS